ncbi:hypothetical protein U91I_02468 [alpha proteobacterium U9-1i]|nr:hypothetical protein U91I_02468 [alpha proteobacterium U9-1i]
MNAPELAMLVEWLAFALCVVASVAAIGALTARSLISMAMFVAAAGATAAGALAASGAAVAAVSFAVVSAVLAPFVILACLLLSTRTAKPRRGARPWPSIVGAAAVVAALLWVLPDLTPAHMNDVGADSSGALFWFAPMFFVGVSATVGLLGYGERGALQRPTERDE